MPLPFILGGLAVLAGAAGAKKAMDAKEKIEEQNALIIMQKRFSKKQNKN